MRKYVSDTFVGTFHDLQDMYKKAESEAWQLYEIRKNNFDETRKKRLAELVEKMLQEFSMEDNAINKFMAEFAIEEAMDNNLSEGWERAEDYFTLFRKVFEKTR